MTSKLMMVRKFSRVARQVPEPCMQRAYPSLSVGYTTGVSVSFLNGLYAGLWPFTFEGTFTSGSKVHLAVARLLCILAE
jgi:hypothetical protein